ncbi:MAG TPA: TRAP transporter small permease [Anaeromyxobacter sp.]|nr:TRAP transporter small permease [Anaeromyxobacter sp.]
MPMEQTQLPAPASGPTRPRGRAPRGALWRFLLQVDKAVEAVAVGLLAAMIVIVFVSVVTRKLFSFVFFWSEEVTLLCLTTFSFAGIAIGFREKLHLSMDVIAGFLPRKVNWVLDRIIDLAIFAFGVYLVVKGWAWTELAHLSTLSATGLPNSVVYAVIPITGVLTCVYAALQLAGVDTRRFQHVDEEIKRS